MLDDAVLMLGGAGGGAAAAASTLELALRVLERRGDARVVATLDQVRSRRAAEAPRCAAVETEGGVVDLGAAASGKRAAGRKEFSAFVCATAKVQLALRARRVLRAARAARAVRHLGRACIYQPPVMPLRVHKPGCAPLTAFCG